MLAFGLEFLFGERQLPHLFLLVKYFNTRSLQFFLFALDLSQITWCLELVFLANLNFWSSWFIAYIAFTLIEVLDLLVKNLNLELCLLQLFFKPFEISISLLFKVFNLIQLTSVFWFCLSIVWVSFSFSSLLLVSDISRYLRVYLSSSISARAA